MTVNSMGRNRKAVQRDFREVDPSDWTVEKLNQRPRLSFVERIQVSRGTNDDWKILEALHYKSHDHFRGAYYYKMTLDGDVIGVIMMNPPKLLCKERHVMFPRLKPGHDTRMTNTLRMKWINANMSIVSRCVVDTMYRGAGLAYRFTNIVARMERKRYVEIQSSMSKYNQFAQRAGFKFCPPMRSNKYDAGIKFMKSRFESDPADTEALVREIMDLPEHRREPVIAEVRRWYQANSMMEQTGKALVKNAEGVSWGDVRVARLPIRELVYQLQSLVLASPLYGFYENPDVDRLLPRVIPLLAFDAQDPTQPLNLDFTNA